MVDKEAESEAVSKSAIPFTWEKTKIQIHLPLGSIHLVNSMDSGESLLLVSSCHNVMFNAAIRDTGGGGEYRFFDNLFLWITRIIFVSFWLLFLSFSTWFLSLYWFIFLFWFCFSGYFDVTVDSVLVEDHYTKSSKFRKILQPLHKQTSNIPEEEEEEKSSQEKWFSLNFQIRPLEDISDYKLSLRINPLAIILSPPLLDRLYDFFRPEKQIFIVSDLRSAAYSQLDALGKQTAAQLALALEDEELVDISVCVVSPNIIVPESFEQVENLLFFCLFFCDL